MRKFPASNFRPWHLRFGLMPPHPGAFFRTDVYSNVGYFNPEYKIAGDFDFFVRVFVLAKYKYKTINQNTVRMSMGGASTSGLKSYFAITEEFRKSLIDNGLFASRLLISGRWIFKILQFAPILGTRNKG